jgi:hypothetical protein
MLLKIELTQKHTYYVGPEHALASFPPDLTSIRERYFPLPQLLHLHEIGD